METKTYGYCRVSSEEQSKEGFSIENQQSRITAYCDFNQLGTPTILTDSGISGKRQANRPAFQQLTKEIEENKVSAVVVYSLSRLGRNTVETLKFIEYLNKKNIALHSLSEKLDTNSAMGKFFTTVLSALCELESNQIGERTSSVLQNKKSNLEPYSNTPYGFTTEGRTKDNNGKITNTGKLKPLEEESKVIQLIFSRNTYPSEIQNFLNSQNIKPKSADKWSRNSIVKILGNKKLYENAGIL